MEILRPSDLRMSWGTATVARSIFKKKDIHLVYPPHLFMLDFACAL